MTRTFSLCNRGPRISEDTEYTIVQVPSHSIACHLVQQHWQCASKAQIIVGDISAPIWCPLCHTRFWPGAIQGLLVQTNSVTFLLQLPNLNQRMFLLCIWFCYSLQMISIIAFSSTVWFKYEFWERPCDPAFFSLSSCLRFKSSTYLVFSYFLARNHLELNAGPISHCILSHIVPSAIESRLFPTAS